MGRKTFQSMRTCSIIALILILPLLVSCTRPYMVAPAIETPLEQCVRSKDNRSVTFEDSNVSVTFSGHKHKGPGIGAYLCFDICPHSSGLGPNDSVVCLFEHRAADSMARPTLKRRSGIIAPGTCSPYCFEFGSRGYVNWPDDYSEGRLVLKDFVDVAKVSFLLANDDGSLYKRLGFYAVDPKIFRDSMRFTASARRFEDYIIHFEMVYVGCKSPPSSEDLYRIVVRTVYEPTEEPRYEPSQFEISLDSLSVTLLHSDSVFRPHRSDLANLVTEQVYRYDSVAIPSDEDMIMVAFAGGLRKKDTGALWEYSRLTRPLLIVSPRVFESAVKE